MIATTFLSGFGLLLAGAWIPAKARLAQVLLQVAWRRVRSGAETARPWPWADATPLARLTIESAGIDEIVLSGATGRILAFAPGHLAGTANPGERGNCVISAHRDTHFAALRKVESGAIVRLETPDGRVTEYRVAGTRVADQHDPSVVRATSGATLTLVTCYPFAAVQPRTTQRFVVFAVEAAAEPARPWFPKLAAGYRAAGEKGRRLKSAPHDRPLPAASRAL